MTIQDLKKEMFKAKKENKIKANVLMMLIDTIQKIAKEDKNDVNEKYIQKGIKKYMKQVEDSIKNGVESAKKELEILKEYGEKILPKEKSDEELIKIIKNLINKIENPNIGKIMQELRKIDGINMKKASNLVKDFLNKNK